MIIKEVQIGMEIDHIDRNKLNNRRNNLRVVTHLQNMHNVGMLSSNKSGISCIHFDKNKQKFIASFTYNKTKYYIGQFDNIISANKKLQEKLKEVKGE